MIWFLFWFLVIGFIVAVVINAMIGAARYAFRDEPRPYRTVPWAKGHPEAADWFTANGYSPAAPTDRRGSPGRYRA